MNLSNNPRIQSKIRNLSSGCLVIDVGHLIITINKVDIAFELADSVMCEIILYYIYIIWNNIHIYKL